ncbi:MAG: hypothetical protein HKN47_20375 [Pirellulaceae bacterium]|nr:hypothetical protein [Pirellulaceae bacterium]
MESAAALLKAQRVEDAASVLSRIAVAHPNVKDAAAAHLQAAVLLSQVDQPKITKTIERLLIQAHQQWPDSSAAQQARRWLITLLTRQGRAEDAAKQATSFLNSSSTVLQVDHALSLWMNLIHNSDPSQTEQWIETFESAFAPLLKHSNIAERYPLAAVYLIEPDSLDSLPATIQATTAEQQFAAALLAWRRRPTESAGLAAPPAQRLQAAQWRLMRDATLDPKRRSAVAQTLLSWPGQSPPQQAAVLIWNNQTKQAIDAIESAAQTSQQPGELWRKLARALASTNRRDDQTEAIKIWDRLASGLPKGSDRWHEAKIAAIELLRHSGDPEQASRRAKYILLTDPPSNPQHALQYKSASSP